MTRVAFVAAAAVLLWCPRGLAQSPVEGKWWKRPRIAQALQLTPDQTAELEKIFSRSKPKLIDLRAELEKKQFAYDQTMQSDTVDRKEVEDRIDAREQARAALQKELALMELDMKQVLKPPQREKLAQMRENAKALMQRRRRMRDFSEGGETGRDATPRAATPRTAKP